MAKQTKDPKTEEHDTPRFKTDDRNTGKREWVNAALKMQEPATTAQTNTSHLTDTIVTEQ